MKEIIKRWCETKSLTLEDASTLITEYLALDGRTISGEELMILLQIGQGAIPINWNYIITQLCLSNNWYIMSVQSTPNQLGQRKTLYTKFYEDNSLESNSCELE